MTDNIGVSDSDLWLWRQKSIEFLRDRCYIHCQARLTVVSQKINEAVPEIVQFLFGTNQPQNIVDPFALNQEYIMKFVNYWTNEYLHQWSGVCMNRVLNPHLMTYKKYCEKARNSADQKKHKFEHMLWQPILTAISQYASYLTQELFVVQPIVLQQTAENIFLWKFMYGIISAKVKFPQSKPMHVITNRVLIENGNMSNFLKSFDSQFDVCSWYTSIEIKLKHMMEVGNGRHISASALKKLKTELQKKVNIAFKEQCLYFCKRKWNKAMKKFNIDSDFLKSVNHSPLVPLQNHAYSPVNQSSPQQMAITVDTLENRCNSSIARLEAENRNLQQILNMFMNARKFNRRNMQSSSIGRCNNNHRCMNNCNMCLNCNNQQMCNSFNVNNNRCSTQPHGCFNFNPFKQQQQSNMNYNNAQPQNINYGSMIHDSNQNKSINNGCLSTTLLNNMHVQQYQRQEGEQFGRLSVMQNSNSSSERYYNQNNSSMNDNGSNHSTSNTLSSSSPFMLNMGQTPMIMDDTTDGSMNQQQLQPQVQISSVTESQSYMSTMDMHSSEEPIIFPTLGVDTNGRTNGTTHSEIHETVGIFEGYEFDDRSGNNGMFDGSDGDNDNCCF